MSDDDGFWLQAANEIFSIKPPVSTDELLRTASCFHPFDPDAIASWVFPTNLPLRAYQRCIVESALFANTLVSIPTGLGKTFIAATVMYNFLRWFPESKIIFLAPTRPLVLQQQLACFQITGISLEKTCVSVSNSPEERASLYLAKSMFFATPQTVLNDLKSGILNPLVISCIVVDEAHRAVGASAFAEIFRYLGSIRNCDFRVLALTATPGSNRESIEQVCANLRIAKIEFRNESSLDVAPYIFGCSRESIIVKLSNDLHSAQQKFTQLCASIGKKLHSAGAIRSPDPFANSAFAILDAQRRFNALNRTNFSLAPFFGAFHKLCLLADTLSMRSLRAFRLSLGSIRADILAGSLKPHKPLVDLVETPEFSNYISWLDQIMMCPGFVSHPKISQVERILLEHFRNRTDDSKVIIFAKYRDIVSELETVLRRHSPLIRIHCFVGQSKSARSLTVSDDGLNQKQQHLVLKNFSSNVFNTLVSTSVGEEGLDIGEVDLIICYDASQSPIQMLQRMGRTGRKRQGKVIFLLSAGKEESSYSASLAKHKSIMNLLYNSTNSIKLHPNLSPRMIPFHLDPICLEMQLNIPKADLCQTKSKTKKTSGPFLSPNEMMKYMSFFHVDEPPFKNFNLNSSVRPKVHKVQHSSTTVGYFKLLEIFEKISLEAYKDQERFLDDVKNIKIEPVDIKEIDIPSTQGTMDSLPELFPEITDWAKNSNNKTCSPDPKPVVNLYKQIFENSTLKLESISNSNEIFFQSPESPIILRKHKRRVADDWMSQPAKKTPRRSNYLDLEAEDSSGSADSNEESQGSIGSFVVDVITSEPDSIDYNSSLLKSVSTPEYIRNYRRKAVLSSQQTQDILNNYDLDDSFLDDGENVDRNQKK